MRFVSDLWNNVGRMCAVRGDYSGRVWKLCTAMANPQGERFYLCRNVVTGEFRAVRTNGMASLY